MALTVAELDAALARLAEQHWFGSPAPAQLREQLRARRSTETRRRRRQLWLLAPVLAACAGAGYATARTLRTLSVEVRLLHDGTERGGGVHRVVVDENGPRPITVQIPGQGPLELRLALPPDLLNGDATGRRLQVLFTTDPGSGDHRATDRR